MFYYIIYSDYPRVVATKAMAMKYLVEWNLAGYAQIVYILYMYK